MLWFIIVLLVVGFLAGALARLLVPGPDPMSLGGTWLLGVVGSFVGGFLGYVLFGADLEDGAVQVGGVIGSVVGAVIVLLVYRTFNRNELAVQLSRPDTSPRIPTERQVDRPAAPSRDTSCATVRSASGWRASRTRPRVRRCRTPGRARPR